MTSTKALIKPELLVWTRNRAKLKLDEAAKAANVEAETLKAWEAGEGAPSVSQLRNLAAKYHFPLAVFYLPKPPFARVRKHFQALAGLGVREGFGHEKQRQILSVGIGNGGGAERLILDKAWSWRSEKWFHQDQANVQFHTS